MDFFLETGVYVLMVALAAGAAGFVALKVLGLGQLLKRPAGSNRRSAAHRSSGEDEFDDWDLSYSGTGEKKAAAAAPKKDADTKASVAATNEDAEETSRSQAARKTPPTTRPPLPREADAIPVPEMGLETKDPAGEVGTEVPEERPFAAQDGAGNGEAIVQDTGGEEQADSASSDDAVQPEEMRDTALDDEPEKTTVAPPDESDEAATAHGMLAMFAEGDDDDSTIGELAETVEDTDIDDLRDAVKIVAAALGSKGESHA